MTGNCEKGHQLYLHFSGVRRVRVHPFSASATGTVKKGQHSSGSTAGTTEHQCTALLQGERQLCGWVEKIFNPILWIQRHYVLYGQGGTWVCQRDFYNAHNPNSSLQRGVQSLLQYFTWGWKDNFPEALQGYIFYLNWTYCSLWGLWERSSVSHGMGTTMLIIVQDCITTPAWEFKAMRSLCANKPSELETPRHACSTTHSNTWDRAVHCVSAALRPGENKKKEETLKTHQKATSPFASRWQWYSTCSSPISLLEKDTSMPSTEHSEKQTL